jgi:hypothetical protein
MFFKIQAEGLPDSVVKSFSCDMRHESKIGRWTSRERTVSFYHQEVCNLCLVVNLSCVRLPCAFEFLSRTIAPSDETYSKPVIVDMWTCAGC